MKLTQIIGLLLCSLYLVPVSSHTYYRQHSKERHIESAADLQQWCKHQSYHHFRRKKLMPYNWTVRTIRQLNDFHALGSWTVENQHFAVSCEIRKGRRAKYTKIEISPSD